MDYLQQVQHGINYIESRLDHEISASDVARVAGLSQWHFQRIFKALTNETLKTYIRSRRMASALDKLLASDQNILEIAVTSGYDTQESFTRAFKNSFGLTPGEYRKLTRRMGERHLFLRKLEFDANYLQHINHNVSLEPEFIDLNSLSLVGLRTCFFSIDSERNNFSDKLPGLWNEFIPRMDEIPHRIAGKAYGIVRQTGEFSEQLEYFATVEVEQTQALPDKMQRLHVDASGYALFRHKGDPRNLDATVNFIYSSWLLNSGKRHSGAPDIEVYGEQWIEDSEDSLMYYAIPVR